jgi:bromodomain-containing factor 1
MAHRSPDSLPNGESHPVATVNGTAIEEKKESAPAVNGHATSHPSLTNGASSTAVKVSTPPTDSLDQSNELPKPEDSGEKKEGSTPLPTVKAEEELKPEETLPKEESKEIPMRDATELQQAKETTTAVTDQLKESSVPIKVSPESALPYADVDMEDAPLSPTKVARERELDLDEEPVAKRAKVNGDIPMTDGVSENFDAPVSTESLAPATSIESSAGITPLQHKYLVKSLTSLKRSNDSRFYREPVDPLKLNIPSYFTVITEPMDLSTIETKLKKNQYTAAAEVASDVELMTSNAVRFNGPDHVVSVEGQRLKALFKKQLEKLPKPDEVEEKKPKKSAALPKEPAPRREPRVSTQSVPKQQNNASSPTFALNPEGLPTIRRDSTNPDGRPKRAIHAPKRDLLYSAKPKKKKFQWELKFCQEILEELHKPKYWAVASPFYYPVDPVALNIPTYHSVIKKPMDLSTVQAKLKAGQYENAKEMETDVLQIFKNCFKFNIPGDPTYQAGQKFEEIFKNKWAAKGRWLEEHDPDSHNQSGSSEEDSDEEESEDDAEQEKLQALQRQIAEMSKQVEAITQKKKKTPPVSKKSSKKAGRKDSKKGSKGDKKSKSSKSERRHITYAEKQLISNGISTLSDKKMQEALKIIQNNVPALKGTQETEIELDIDELPNEVLMMLLKFVKKNAPQVMEDDDLSAPVSATVQSKPKKNKPMSKFEQEAQINMLEGSLSRFQGGGGGGTRSPEPVHSVEDADSSDGSDDDDDSEESEEE